MGVDHKTVVNDMHAGENSPERTQPAAQDSDSEDNAGENSPLAAKRKADLHAVPIGPDTLPGFAFRFARRVKSQENEAFHAASRS